MKKTQNRCLFIILISAVVVLSIVLVWQFSKSSTQSSNTITENMDGIKEPTCPYEYELKLLNDNFMDNVRNDCPNINGGTHNGDFEIELEVLNRNDIPLSIPCKFIFTKTFFNSDPIHSIEKEEEFTIFVGAKSTKKESFKKSFPECYTGWKVDCKDIDELPECLD